METKSVKFRQRIPARSIEFFVHFTNYHITWRVIVNLAR